MTTLMMLEWLMIATAQHTISLVTDAQMWALVVGAASPPLIAIVQRPTLSTQIRVLIALVWSALAGTGTAYFAGQFSGRGVVSAILVVLVAAITTYEQVWRPLRIAPWIEAKTSPRAHVAVLAEKSPTATTTTAVPATPAPATPAGPPVDTTPPSGGK